MENTNWGDLCHDTNKISQELNILISRSKTKRDIILKLNPKTDACKIIELLADDNHEFNSFLALCKLLKLVCSKNDARMAWEKNYYILNQHIIQFNTDYALYEKLVSIPHNNLHDLLDKFFLNKIIKGFRKYGIFDNKANERVKKVIPILSKINSLEEKLVSDYDIKDLLSLVQTRKEYISLINYDNYILFQSEVDILNLKNTLQKLITPNIHNTCYHEINTICKKINKNKLLLPDITKYRESTINNHKLKLTEAFDIVINFLTKLFNLTFIKQEKIITWSNNVEIYNIKYQNTTYGYLYIDLFKDNRKLPHLVSLILKEAVVYPYSSGVLNIPVMVLLGNHSIYISYLDVINIFKEMGNILHAIFHRSKFQVINLDLNMRSFMSHLFEHIAYDIEVIKLFFPENKRPKMFMKQ